MKTTQHVLNWFLDRGVFIKPSCIVWHWENGKMWFIVNQPDEGDIDNTESGCVDITYTHAENGSPTECFEIYDSIPVKTAPPAVQEKLSLKKAKR
jgi:hypothetical protein